MRLSKNLKKKEQKIKLNTPRRSTFLADASIFLSLQETFLFHESQLSLVYRSSFVNKDNCEGYKLSSTESSQGSNL